MADPIASLKGSPYGALVYDAALSVLDSPELASTLSDPTVVQVGTWLTSIYTIATSDGDTIDIVNSSVELGLEMAISLAIDVASDVASIVPVVGQMAQVVFGVAKAVESAEAAAERARAAEIIAARKKLSEHSKLYDPVGSGPGGETMPSDLFVQIRTSPRPIIETGRTPAIGVMLRALTEYQWPLELVMSWVGAPIDTMPSSVKDALNPSGVVEWGDPIWPPIADYAPTMAKLRIAMSDQQVTRRSNTDQGQSLWPLYMDLLYSLVYVPRLPWGLQERPGAVQGKDWIARPLLDERTTSAMFRAAGWAAPPVVYQASQARVQGYPYWNDSTAELARLTKGGQGDWSAAFDAVYRLAYNWDLSVRPLNFADRSHLQQTLADALPRVESVMRDRLVQRGLGPRSSLKRSTSALLSRAVASGLVSEQIARRAAARANAGAAVASSLALGALAWYFSV